MISIMSPISNTLETTPLSVTSIYSISKSGFASTMTSILCVISNSPSLIMISIIWTPLWTGDNTKFLFRSIVAQLLLVDMVKSSVSTSIIEIFIVLVSPKST